LNFLQQKTTGIVAAATPVVPFNPLGYLAIFS
jgi:hypothetical protein